MGVVHWRLQFGYAESATLRHASSWPINHRATTMRTPRAALRVLALGAVTAVVLTAAACGIPTVPDLGGMDLCPSTVSAEKISMQAPDSTLRIGSTVQVTAFPVDVWGAYELCAPSVQFASGDPGVAMVSSDGLVTGVSAGTAYIRANSGTVRDSVAIKVVAATVASVDMR